MVQYPRLWLDHAGLEVAYCLVNPNTVLRKGAWQTVDFRDLRFHSDL